MKPIPTPKNVVHHLRAMHDRLNDGWANVDDAWWTTEAAAIIERLVDQRDKAEAARAALKVERDEARREVCAHEADTVEDQYAYSAQRGWNCFASLAETAREMYKGGD
jgi:hypothetical protein